MLALLSLHIPENNQNFSARIEFRAYGHTRAYRIGYSSPRSFNIEDSLSCVVSMLLQQTIEYYPTLMNFDGTLTQFGDDPYGLSVIPEPDLPTLIQEFKRHGVTMTLTECN